MRVRFNGWWGAWLLVALLPGCGGSVSSDSQGNPGAGNPGAGNPGVGNPGAGNPGADPSDGGVASGSAGAPNVQTAASCNAGAGGQTPDIDGGVEAPARQCFNQFSHTCEPCCSGGVGLNSDPKSWPACSAELMTRACTPADNSYCSCGCSVENGWVCAC